MTSLDHLDMPMTWVVDDHVEMTRLIALNSPTLIFVNRIEDQLEATLMLEAMGHQVVVLEKNVSCTSLGGLLRGKRKHAVAFICGVGWLRGWHSTIPSSVIMWSRNWDKAQVAQASARPKRAMPFTRTFIYASPNDQAETP